jgi:hypothetical protein
MNTNKLAQNFIENSMPIIHHQILITKYCILKITLEIYKIPLLKQNNETKYKCSIDKCVPCKSWATMRLQAFSGEKKCFKLIVNIQ